MRFNGPNRTELAIAVGLISLLMFSAQSMAQTAATPATTQVGLQCNGTLLLDPFNGSLAGPNLPAGLLPIDASVKDKILKSGLPCQENVSTGAQGDLAGVESVGLENLQRGFDFYSWRTFIALNSPADGKSIAARAQADSPTRWEDRQFQTIAERHVASRRQGGNWQTTRQDGGGARKAGPGPVP